MDFIATLPGWAIAGAICAVIGGVAGLIGAALQKAGMKWGRFLPVVAIAAGVALANGGLVDWVRGAAISKDAAARMMVTTSPEFYGYVQQNFPQDFDILAGEMTSILKAGGSSEQVSRRAAEAVAQLRHRYAGSVGQAADADLAALVDNLIGFYTALEAQGTELCNAVAINGPMVLLGRPDARQVATLAEPQAALVMRAAKSAIDNPVTRRPSSDADWAEIADAMLARGATEAHLNAIGTLDPASPDLCPGVLHLLRTLNEVDNEAVKTVRAEYLANLAAA